MAGDLICDEALRLAVVAPAKVNLYLHVGKLQPDGFHPLSSWMAFADVGDRVTAESAAAVPRSRLSPQAVPGRVEPTTSSGSSPET